MYGALFNSSYVPNPLEKSYLADPARFLSPYLFGGLVSHFFFGVFTCQTVNYWQAFGTTDPWLQKTHVGVVVLLTWFKIVQIILALWKREAAEWGNFFELTQIESATKITSLSSCLVTVAVQIFFINRCFRLSQHNYLFLVATSACCALSLAASLWITVTMPQDFSAKNESFIQASRLFPAASVATDALITTFTMYYLVRARRSAISRTTDNMITRLLRITLQSALPPLITASVSAAFTGQKLGPFVFMFLSITPLLQAFSMMYTLNCRFELRKAASSHFDATEDNTTMRWGNPTRSAPVTGANKSSAADRIKLQEVSVNVTQTVETRSERRRDIESGVRSGWYNEDSKQDIGYDSGSFDDHKSGVKGSTD